MPGELGGNPPATVGNSGMGWSPHRVCLQHRLLQRPPGPLVRWQERRVSCCRIQGNGGISLGGGLLATRLACSMLDLNPTHPCVLVHEGMAYSR